MKKTNEINMLKFNKKRITNLNDSYMYSVNGGTTITATTATTATNIINMSKNTLCTSDVR